MDMERRLIVPMVVLPFVAFAIYKLDPNSTASALQRHARDAFESGDYGLAERSYRKALEVAPSSDHRLYTGLGICLVALQRRGEAAHAFESALVLSPTSAHTRKLLETQYRHLGEDSLPLTEASIMQLERAVAASPRDGEAYTALAKAWHRVGAKREALSALEAAAALNPSSDTSWHNVGVLQMTTLGAASRASESFERALRLNPSNMAAHVILRTVKPRNDRAAHERLRQAVEDAPHASLQQGPQDEHYMLLARNLVGGGDGTATSPALASDTLESLHRDGFLVRDGVLGRPAQRYLQRAAVELAGRMSAGVVGVPTAADRGERRSTRSDRIVRLPVAAGASKGGTAAASMSSELVEGLHALRDLFHDLHKTLLHALPPDMPPLWPQEELQFACYGAGGHYSPHEDAGATASGGGRFERVVTAIYYPNDGDEDEWHNRGGLLRLWPRPGDYRAEVVAPVGDRLVLFWSDRTHEVTALALGASGRQRGGTERCAFTQWFSALQSSTE